MIIKNALAVEVCGGYFWDDQSAIQKGAKRDGFIFLGSPVTPGFDAIRQPSEAISIMLLLEGGRIALGDCCSVQYSARSGRGSVFRSGVYKPFIQEKVLPFLIGKKITRFKDMAEEFCSIEVEGKQLHCSIQYGVTQALLDAVAQSQGRTMTEVISDEYGTRIAKKLPRILAQLGDDDWYIAVDRMILRRIDIFPHLLINTLDSLEKIPKHIKWTRERIQKLAGSEYHPFLHYDIYGTLGKKCNNNIPHMLKHLNMWRGLARPYKLQIECPVDLSSRDETIEMMAKLIKAKQAAGLDVIIVADEWCNKLEDIMAFVDNEAADMVQIKSPDLGGVNSIIEAILYCKEKGVYAYQGGSCCETDVSARVSWHIALATEPFQVLDKPGMGMDEGYQIGVNEVNRTLALIQQNWVVERA